MRFVSIYVVHPYRSIDTAAASKTPHFILSDRSDFHMIDNLSRAVQASTRRISTSLSVDEIMLLRYMNLSTNFRGRPLKVEMAPSRLKHTYSIYLRSSRGRCLLLPVLDYVVEICKNCYIICIVCDCNSFCRMSASELFFFNVKPFFFRSIDVRTT